MKKQWLAAVAVIGICAFSLTACKKESGQEQTEVLQEDLEAIEEAQNKIIAEYAAGVLMKYNAGTTSRVLEGKKMLVEKQKEEAKKIQEEKRQELFEKYETESTKKQESSEKDDTSSDKTADMGVAMSQVEYISDLSGAVDNSSFSITYSGYEISDSYKGNDEIISFAIDAKNGKSLIISKFLVTNIGGQEEELNLLAIAPEFKVKISDKIVKAEQTMLLNDLSMYKESFAVGETKEAVIVFEIPQEMTGQAENMELIINANNVENRMLLESLEQVEARPVEEAMEDITEESEVQEPPIEETQEELVQQETETEE